MLLRLCISLAVAQAANVARRKRSIFFHGHLENLHAAHVLHSVEHIDRLYFNHFRKPALRKMHKIPEPSHSHVTSYY